VNHVRGKVHVATSQGAELARPEVQVTSDGVRLSPGERYVAAGEKGRDLDRVHVRSRARFATLGWEHASARVVLAHAQVSSFEVRVVEAAARQQRGKRGPSACKAEEHLVAS
jgi:hypothetical protein